MSAEPIQPRPRSIEQACESGGQRRLRRIRRRPGATGWRLLCDGLVSEARLNDLGVEIAAHGHRRPLTNRLQIVELAQGTSRDRARHRSSSPSSSSASHAPGTTILFDLLAQDPAASPAADVGGRQPVPAAAARDLRHRSAHRRDAGQASRCREQIVPGPAGASPDGRAWSARSACASWRRQFGSMIFSVQYRLPTYYRWLLHEADHRAGLPLSPDLPAAPAVRRYAGQWLLKSPAHLWQLDTLVAEYPDAVIVQTHRDPLNVISSISALTHHLRRLASDDSSVDECAAQSREEIVVGLERGMALRDSGALAPGQVIDVQFADFMPIRSRPSHPLRRVGPGPEPVAEHKHAGLPRRPPRRPRWAPLLLGRHGSGRGRWCASRSRDYQRRFGVADEPIR